MYTNNFKVDYFNGYIKMSTLLSCARYELIYIHMHIRIPLLAWSNLSRIIDDKVVSGVVVSRSVNRRKLKLTNVRGAFRVTAVLIVSLCCFIVVVLGVHCRSECNGNKSNKQNKTKKMRMAKAKSVQVRVLCSS